MERPQISSPRGCFFYWHMNTAEVSYLCVRAESPSLLVCVRCLPLLCVSS